VKGSIISGEEGEVETFGVGSGWLVEEKGCEERRRIACEMVGWKSPP